MGLTHTLILCPAALVFGVSIKLCYNKHTPRLQIVVFNDALYMHYIGYLTRLNFLIKD